MAANINDKVTLWMLEFEAADLDYLGKLDVGGASTLEALRLSLESNDVLDWAFDFWDVEDRRRVRRKLERLNGFSREVHVIRSANNTDSEGSKHRRLEDRMLHVSITEHALPVEDEAQFVEVEEEDYDVPPVASSRVSGVTNSDEVDNNPLKSTLLTTSVTDRYLERAKKLRAELKRVAMEDHEWWLKTFDLNACGVVKLWCDKCKKDCGGGGSTDHTKAQIDNLFNNFR